MRKLTRVMAGFASVAVKTSQPLETNVSAKTAQNGRLALHTQNAAAGHAGAPGAARPRM